MKYVKIKVKIRVFGVFGHSRWLDIGFGRDAEKHDYPFTVQTTWVSHMPSLKVSLG